MVSEPLPGSTLALMPPASRHKWPPGTPAATLASSTAPATLVSSVAKPPPAVDGHLGSSSLLPQVQQWTPDISLARPDSHALNQMTRCRVPPGPPSVSPPLLAGAEGDLRRRRQNGARWCSRRRRSRRRPSSHQRRSGGRPRRWSHSCPLPRRLVLLPAAAMSLGQQGHRHPREFWSRSLTMASAARHAIGKCIFWRACRSSGRFISCLASLAIMTDWW